MKHIQLPEAKHDSHVSVETAIYKRRSVREYSGEPIGLKEAALLLWAAQGITALGGYRTTPSAGALYPLEVYLAAGNVDGLPPGFYHYAPTEHRLVELNLADHRAELSTASRDQKWMQKAAAMIILTGFKTRLATAYGQHAAQFLHMEAGHAAQNVCLEAFALNLGATVVGSFDEKKIKTLLKLNVDETPCCILPVGRR